MADAKKDKADEVKAGDSPYNDVSGDVETVQAALTEENRNDDGIIEPSDEAKAAGATLQAEQSLRGSGQAEGGGPWPDDVLRRKFLGAGIESFVAE